MNSPVTQGGTTVVSTAPRSSRAPKPVDILLPPSGPSALDVADRDRWEELTSTSLTSVRASAEAWRNGSAALITLVGSGLLLKGPASAQDLPWEWRLLLTCLVGLGLACALGGLGLALSAAAGVPTHETYTTVRKAGGVQLYQLSIAKAAASTLKTARKQVTVALVLLLAAAVSSWWAPGKEDPKSSSVLVQRQGQPAVCGALVAYGGTQLVVKVAGSDTPTAIPLADVTGLMLAASCDP